MIDWKPGDKLIFIHGHPGMVDARIELQPLRIGQPVIFRSWTELYGDCDLHGKKLRGALVEGSSWAYCHGCFRKPLDLNKLFNVHTSKPVKETADA